jgi:hypothetical protein
MQRLRAGDRAAEPSRGTRRQGSHPTQAGSGGLLDRGPGLLVSRAAAKHRQRTDRSAAWIVDVVEAGGEGEYFSGADPDGEVGGCAFQVALAAIHDSAEPPPVLRPKILWHDQVDEAPHHVGLGVAEEFGRPLLPMHDLDPTALPTDETGAVEETGEGMEVVDEVEDIPVGDTPTLTIDDLTAGSYVLICNIYDEEEQEAHYSEGMRTGFTVE